jgi:Carbohydrate esterase, sialic acid-specific acetylesterase
MKLHLQYGVVFLFLATNFAFGATTVATLVDYQVLQRTLQTKTDIPLSGSYDLAPGTHIQARISYQDNGSDVAGFSWATVDTGTSGQTWNGVLRNVPVGGEYVVQLRAGTLIFATISHVLVGDLWACGGQSNMVGQGELDMSDAPISRVHALTAGNPWSVAVEPLGDVGCGPALRFARNIVAATGIPVGLVFHAVGGSGIEFWQKGTDYYNAWTSLIESAGKSITGVIWYQGEYDVCGSEDHARSYKALLNALISDIRRFTGNATAYWVQAQLATIGTTISDSSMMIVREIQRQLPLEDPYAATITTVDMPRKDDFHFNTPAYQTFGDRFAAAALYKAYGKPSVQLGPKLSLVSFADSGAGAAKTSLVVRVRDVSGRLAPAGAINGFYRIQKGAVTFPISAFVKDSQSMQIAFSTLNATDASGIPLQPFYDVSISAAGVDTMAVPYPTVLFGAAAMHDNDHVVDLKVLENPLGFYAILAVTFPEISGASASLSLYSLTGQRLRTISLAPKATRCTISKRFLPAGCYVLYFRDNDKIGIKKTFWNLQRR